MEFDFKSWLKGIDWFRFFLKKNSRFVMYNIHSNLNSNINAQNLHNKLEMLIDLEIN